MQVDIQCPICKKVTLAVKLFGPCAEYATQCPACGPVFGFVLFGPVPIEVQPPTL
jgi:hypothetical protein